MTPPGALSILDARMAGKRPDRPVVVSFVGDTGWGNPHVYPQPGKTYDWRFLVGLPVYIVVKEGVNVGGVVKAISEVAMPYPTLVDIERKRAASIMPDRLWQWRPDCAQAKELFA